MYNYPQMSAADNYSDKPIWSCKDEYCMKYDCTWSWQYFFQVKNWGSIKRMWLMPVACRDVHSHLYPMCPFWAQPGSKIHAEYFFIQKAIF